MAKYKISGTGVIDTTRNAHIPNDTGNRDWQEYLVWAADGTNVADAEFTQEELDNQAWSTLRGERDRLLSATDFMMTYDFHASMTEQEQSDVTIYRQDLRDLPDDTSDPENPTWPTKPQIVIDQGI